VDNIDDLRRDLPNWPLAILDDWLKYFAREPDLGWPPPEPLGNHRWARILGGRSLAWWYNVTWKKHSVDCDLAKLCPRSRHLTIMIHDDIHNRRADEVESRRYKMPLQYLLEHGVFLNALVAMNRPDGLLVLDGYHRMAALHGLRLLPEVFFEKPNRRRPALLQDAWIGVHPNGELPLT
jgi:hypothetical protein